MNRTFICTTVALIAVGSALSACRSARRGVRVGADAAKLQVTMHGLTADDANRSNWLYELSGCMTPINGELGADGKVAFTAIGLKAGLENCQFRVKTLQAEASIKFVEGSEPNVLYWARSLNITQDAAGQLIADASLQRLFEVVVPGDARKTFTLTIPVKFSKPENESPVTAALKCSPAVANVGEMTRSATSDGSTGTVQFKLPIEKEMQYACTDMFVSVAGKLHKYKGSFVGSQGNFTATPDKETKLAELDLILQDTTNTPLPDDKNDVSVSTKAAECNSEGKFFDVATGECKAKQ